jgi:Mpv17 / PMP22 family
MMPSGLEWEALSFFTLPILPTGLEGEAFGFIKDSLTAAVTGGAGDVIAQLAAKQSKQGDNTGIEISDEPFELDVRRTLSYATFAAGYTGAFQHALFANLQESIPEPLVRLALNQGLIIPLCYYSLLVWLVPKMRATSMEEEERLRSSINVLQMIPRNWAFWVPLQFIQFAYIPTEYQVIYCCFLALIWNVILSFFTSGASKTESLPLPETALVSSKGAESKQRDFARRKPKGNILDSALRSRQ